MPNLLLLLFLGLLLGGFAVVIALLLRLARAPGLERLERELRAAVDASAQGLRTELAAQLGQFQQMLLNQQAQTQRTQTAQLEALTGQLGSLQKNLADTLVQQIGELTRTNTQTLQALQAQLGERVEALRLSTDQRLREMQADNERKLEQMRLTVDEKLHATLEQRLGESFKQVAERLELVHRGLGEMQTLAQGVGDLRRVFSNVKSRGVFGEVQLAALLEQVFTVEQYGVNVETVPGSGARVEFAVRLPGNGDGPLWLPIDAKFPREDYERLLDAQERADKVAADAASRALETRLRDEARTIHDKYIAAPYTADFAILFVPTEGLYAEALRRPGLVEALQREQRVMLAGPTTLLALLNSLQMGFRTLALQERSTEVWKVLGAVKTEFAKFGDVLAKARKKLDEASNSIGAAETRTRVMNRQLKAVEALPGEQAQTLLGLTEIDPGDDTGAL